MAKKKKSSNAHVEKKPLHEENTGIPHQQPQPQPQPPAMDSEASETIDKLMTLNQRLLKETVESRQEIETLYREKDSLESRSNKEKDALRSELAWLGESVAMMDLERGVVADFVAKQMAALKSGVELKEREIGRLIARLNEAEGVLQSERAVSKRLLAEKEDITKSLDLQIEETEKLQELLSESEGAMLMMNTKIEQLTDAHNAVVLGKEYLEMSLEEVRESKDDLQKEFGRVVQEKEAIEEEMNGEMFKRKELENAVSELNATVAGLQEEDRKRRATVALLERQCREGVNRCDETRSEMDRLMVEKNSTDKKLEWLLVEKNTAEKKLSEAIKQVDDQKLKFGQLVSVKNTIEEAKVQLESEVAALRNEVADLETANLKLNESAKANFGKIKKLESDIAQHRQKLAVVESEKAKIENHLCEEKKNAAALQGVIAELEQKVKESTDAAGKAKAENAVLQGKKSALENECKALNEKVASLEPALEKARNEVDSIKGKAQKEKVRSERVLNLLKETVAFCAKDDNGVENESVVAGADADKEDSDEWGSQLEMIRSAFISKTSKVDSMKREVELLQSSVEKAHKRKGFWTIFSSATTVLAAVSLAYIARSSH